MAYTTTPRPSSQSCPAFLGRTSELVQDRKQQNADAVVVYDGDFGLSTRPLLGHSQASSQAPTAVVPMIIHAPLHAQLVERPGFPLSYFGEVKEEGVEPVGPHIGDPLTDAVNSHFFVRFPFTDQFL
jgi:hypothetical protein